MVKSNCFEQVAEVAAETLLCPPKSETKCCPQFNKNCCPVTIRLEHLGGGNIKVTIENKSKAPLYPFLRFAYGPVVNNGCVIGEASSDTATILGYRKRFTETGDADGYDVLVRINEGVPKCNGKVEVDISCATASTSTSVQACIECFCPDLEAVAKCKSIAALCRARALSTPRGIHCCVPVCSNQLVVFTQP